MYALNNKLTRHLEYEEMKDASKIFSVSFNFELSQASEKVK